MSGTSGSALRIDSAALAAICAVVTCSATAAAQAWVPPQGIGVVSVVYQDIDNTGHRLTDGSMLDGYDSISRGVLFNLDYAVTDRFSFSVGLPYLGAKYTGPEPSFFGLPIDDCLCWNRGWQDVSATLRYNLTNAMYGVTPSVSFGVPSHDYDYFGEAVLGRNLKELRVAVDAGRRLDEISDRLSVSGRLAFAFVEKVADIPNNRTNALLEAGLLATRRLATRFAVAWQHSHGGLASNELFSDETLISQYDRLIKDNNLHVTAGAAYSLSWFDVFGSYTHYAGGTDTHSGRALTVGISWPFER